MNDNPSAAWFSTPPVMVTPSNWAPTSAVVLASSVLPVLSSVP
jgi:hypothetical protein